MNKRILTLVIILALIIVPFTAAYSGTTQVNSSTQFFKWLNDCGTPIYSVSGSYQANYYTYRDYGLIVYGSPSDVPGNEYKDGEYRYLGYTFLESMYTNQLFPNDADFGILPEDWDYAEVAGAEESWDSLEQSIQKPYMLYTRLVGHGATTLTAADIGISKARVQSPSTWLNTGSIYTYKSNGYYATFTVPSMGMGILTASMLPEIDRIEVSGSDSGRNVNINLWASVNKPKDEIRFIKVIFHLPEGDKVRFFHNTSSIDIVQPAKIIFPDILPGTVEITATVTSESIFGDKLERNVSCHINVVEGSTSTPSPSGPGPSATPRPPSATPGPTAVPTPVPTPSPTPVPGPDPDEYEPLRKVEIWGDWNYWKDNPHRFLALEKIHLKVTVNGYVRKIVVRLSSQLENMQYTNSDGYTYDYSEDFFGYYVLFPRDSTIYPDYSIWGLPAANWDYIIPLCDETIGWDGNRKSLPYRMTITIAGHSGESQVHIIDDIDITGNTYELLHPQPLN